MPNSDGKSAKGVEVSWESASAGNWINISWQGSAASYTAIELSQSGKHYHSISGAPQVPGGMQLIMSNHRRWLSECEKCIAETVAAKMLE